MRGRKKCPQRRSLGYERAPSTREQRQVPAEARAVRLLFRLYLRLGSARAAAAALNAAGARTRSGARWGHTSVLWALRQPRHAYHHAHSVTARTFERARELRVSYHRPGRRACVPPRDFAAPRKAAPVAAQGTFFPNMEMSSGGHCFPAARAVT